MIPDGNNSVSPKQPINGRADTDRMRVHDALDIAQSLDSENPPIPRHSNKRECGIIHGKRGKRRDGQDKIVKMLNYTKLQLEGTCVVCASRH